MFAGIGGIELGLRDTGFEIDSLCDADPAARAVLRQGFPTADLADDVVDVALDDVRGSDLLTGGFPCQDLSQAGRRAGIRGERSGLVEHLLRLLGPGGPTTLVVENVPFMLSLDQGHAMSWLVERLERAGFRWAYRVVDALAFGLPQRRRRVVLVASTVRDPRAVLLNDPGERAARADDGRVWCGFYWTEGNRGIGWAVDAVPPLKGGSGLGIPSAPAIWQREARRMVTPGIEDAEALQGFRRGWTDVGDLDGRARIGARWRMVGNAVSVRVSEWLGWRLATDERYRAPTAEVRIGPDDRWPQAAWGGPGGRRFSLELPGDPAGLVQHHEMHLHDLVQRPAPLSERATRGFFGRLERSSLRRDEQFVADHEAHLKWLRSTTTG